MSSDTPDDSGSDKELPQRFPKNKTNTTDYQKSNDKSEQKDNDNGKW